MQIYEQRGVQIFELLSGHQHLPVSHSKDLAVVEDDPSTLYLPRVYCARLRVAVQSEAYPVPEASRLAPDHPLLTELRELQTSCGRALEALRHEIDERWPPHVAGAEAYAAMEQLERTGVVSAEQFHSLAAALRDGLGLPKDRAILPRNRVGPPTVLINAVRLPDLLVCGFKGLPLLVRDTVVDRLERAGITGYEVYPVKIMKYKGKNPPPPLFELSVTGRAGLPGAGSTPWFLQNCEACGLQHTVGWLDKVVVDPDQYDGSDIFCFSPWPQVFVTERFLDAVRHPLLIGASFRPMSVSGAAW